MSNYLLYGSEMSYFSGKARAYLRWKGIDFEERNSDEKFYNEVCIPRIGYRMIPLVITPYNQTIQDTTLIMDYFEQLEDAGPSLIASGPVQQLVARLIELYADEWLLIPAMHYRWEYDADATITEFGLNMLPGMSIEEQQKAGAEMASVFSGSGPILGIHKHTKEAVEQSWRQLLSELDTHFRHHPYLLGSRPCTGDFALVGALYAHFYRDATAGALMRKEGIAVAQYVERMMFPRGGLIGDYLPEDTIPETLIPVLSRMMREQMPCVDVTARQLATWKLENPDVDIPRMIGEHEFWLEGLSAKRGIFPYATWLFGRARELYDTMDGNARKEADHLLGQCGGELFGKIPINAPVKLQDFQLQWA